MESPAEKKREEMMDDRADDLPFRLHFHSGFNWALFSALVLAGLAVPLFYLAISLLATLTMDQGLFLLVTGLVLATLVAGAIFTYAYLRRNWMKVGTLMTTVEQVMAREVVFCGVLDSLQDCAKVMYDSNVGFLVCQNENDEAVGVLTDRDIVCGAIANRMDPMTTPVTLVMEREIKSVTPKDPIDKAIEIMRREGIRRLPVLAGSKCVGVLTLDDLLVKRVCSHEDAIAILSRQFSEPGVSSASSEKVTLRHAA
jgi:CBS domain-containing protein